MLAARFPSPHLFRFTLGVSLLLHAGLLAVHFQLPNLSRLTQAMPTLEVTLVNSQSKSKPIAPDVLAQTNLDGGGNTDSKRQMATPMPVEPQPQPSTQVRQAQKRVQELEQQAKQLMTQIKAQEKVTVAPKPTPAQETQPTPSDAQELVQKSLEVARLEGKITRDWDAYQKRPRRQFIGARAQEYRFAQYVEDWRLKIERVGNLNYPEEARRQRLYGKLQMTVSIRADGSVDSVEINRSSGTKVLDDAARHIVQMAAPYAPFPDSIRKDTDILSITRTWSFTKSDQLASE